MLKVVQDILSSFVLSFEVLVRKNFGERYLTSGKVVFATSWYIIYFLIINALEYASNAFSNPYSVVTSYSRTASVPKNSGSLSLAFFIFFICVVFFMLKELMKVEARKKKGEQWHSWNSGVERNWIVKAGTLFGIYQVCNRLFGKYIVTRFITQLYVEPVIFFGAGVVLLFIPTAGPLGVWLILGSIMLAIKSHGLYDRFKDQYLDAIDSQIEAEHFTDALIERKAPEETGGFTPMSLSHPITEEQKKSVAESMQAFEKDNPNLSKHMKSKPTVIG